MRLPSLKGNTIWWAAGGLALVAGYFILTKTSTGISPVDSILRQIGGLVDIGRQTGIVPPSSTMPMTPSGPMAPSKYLPDSTQPVPPATPVKASAYADWYSDYAGVEADQNRLSVA